MDFTDALCSSFGVIVAHPKHGRAQEIEQPLSRAQLRTVDTRRTLPDFNVPGYKARGWVELFLL